MGLDLILYKVDKKGTFLNDDNELAYGRKTWAIEDYFHRKSGVDPDVYDWVVTEDVWNGFIATLKPYLENTFLKEMIENYDECDDQEDWGVEILIDKFLEETLHDDGVYSLGPVWEARALIRWYDADEKVQECFKKKIPVRILASF